MASSTITSGALVSLEERMESKISSAHPCGFADTIQGLTVRSGLGVLSASNDRRPKFDLGHGNTEACPLKCMHGSTNLNSFFRRFLHVVDGKYNEKEAICLPSAKPRAAKFCPLVLVMSNTRILSCVTLVSLKK